MEGKNTTKSTNSKESEASENLGVLGITLVQYADFEKLDMRVAEVKDAKDIEGADKLYELTIDLGEDQRTICAGIKEFYPKEKLIGKKIIVLTNLAPRKLRGIESQGMLLAASDKDHKKISLIVPDQNIEVGSSVN